MALFGRRFPFVKQHDSMECGVACLTSVLRHYGLNVGTASVAEHCCPTTEGVSLLAISEAAEDFGMETAAGKATMEELRKAPLPAIIHWKQNHFTVLHRISRKGKRFHICDPAKGLTVCSEAEMEQCWLSTTSLGERKGIALFLTPGEEFGKKAQGSGEKRSFRFILGYLREYRHYLIQIFFGLLLGCVLQLIFPFLTQAIVDRGIAGRDIGIIWLILLGELMIVAGRTATDFIRRWMLLHISMRINISLVSDFFIKLLRLPMGFFDTKLTGDLLQRMSDHGRVQSFLTGQTLGIAFSTLSFIVFGIVLLVYSPLIFGIFLAGSVIYGLWIASFLRRRRVLDYELFEQMAANQNKTYQFITCMQEIKLQNCERRRRWEWEDVQADLFEVQMKSMKLQQAQEAGNVFINEIKNILITVFAATAVIHGEITLGAMLAIQYIVGQLNSPVEQFMAFLYAVQDVKISLERINEIHDADNEGAGNEGTLSENGSRTIRMDNVDFRYNRHSPEKTLDNISLDIPEGKVTAIVGASGSGKTTIIKLLLGYYPVESGTICIGSRDIGELDPVEWRKRCGVVMQDGVIFSESIARNIAVSDGEIDHGRMAAAARTANIEDFVMSLPLKYDTKIGRDGVGLSQGQKQRILIARAVYRNPDFIFLDEATNALDAENERAIVENLAAFYRGKTVVVVAHRLSTVRNADNIVVLERGRIAESGTHDRLVEERGKYYNLVRNQLELGA